MLSKLAALFGFTAALATLATAAEARRPNVLIAIADDQSWQLTSFAGYRAVQTPAFDRVAREGVYFENGFAASPGCSPSRAALLTGRHTWQIEQAGTHASDFPRRYAVFPDVLEKAGYFIGATGKAWGPGNWKDSGWPHNPAGPDFGAKTTTPPTKGISNKDYAGNFQAFLAKRPQDRPFYFWYGGQEPHRGYEKGSGLKAGKKLADAVPPPFLPDTPEVRSDILDACLEIEWFDRHLGMILAALEQAGELDNTIVIVTADNGMPFPRAKANAYEHGIHVPLAIRWGARAPGGRRVQDVVGFVDLTATILEATGTRHPNPALAPSGRSIMNILTSTRQGMIDADRVAFAARERHSSARYDNWTYPQRALRTSQYLYIRNFRSDRWPAGDPVVLKDDGTPDGPHSGYKDIDGGPTLDDMIAKAGDPKLGQYLQWAVAKRPAEELFDVRQDPGCLKNLASDPRHAGAKTALAKQLEQKLREMGDTRILDGGENWEKYPRHSPIRKFPRPADSR